MNCHRSSSVLESKFKSSPDKQSTQRFMLDADQSRTSDQQHFQRLLNDLERTDSRSEIRHNEADTSSHASSLLTGDKALENTNGMLNGEAGEETSAFTDEQEMTSFFHSGESEESRAEQRDVDDRCVESDLSAMALSTFIPAPGTQGSQGGEAEPASLGSLPLNDAAERIIQEMQNRSRRRETRRWQFSLQGLQDKPVEVTIECLADQSWRVELCTADNCSDEDCLALQQRLAEQMDDVSVFLVGS